jgi:hypothetical protein
MFNLPLELDPVEDRPGWYRTAPSTYAELERQAIQLQVNLPDHLQLFCGMLGYDIGHAIYVIENISSIEIAREFQVGSHNAFGPSIQAKVCNELTRVFEIANFRPYFIDAAGYKARFLKQITENQAASIEEILTQGLEGYASEWSGDGPLLANTVLEENQIRLWWD